MKQLVDMCPLDSILAFVRAFGGTNQCVPREPSPTGTIARTIGMAHATAIIGALGFGRIDVPLCARLARSERNEAIVKRYGELQSLRRVALEFGVHQVTIRRALKAERNRRALVKVVKVRAARAGE